MMVNKFNVNALYVESRLNGWSRINGYNINEVLKQLGYTFDDYKETKEYVIKKYTNANGNVGNLCISGDLVPVFYTTNRFGKQQTIIEFNKLPKIKEFIFLPDTDLGVIEYGNHFNYMEFFSEQKRKYKYIQERRHDKEDIVPDEIKTVDSTELITIINEVHLWASEIRRSLAPKNDIITK